MKRFFHTLVTLLLLAACTDGNNELGSKDPFSIPDKEGCNVKGTVFDDYGTPLEGIVVSDGLQTTQTDRNGHFWLSSDLSKRRSVGLRNRIQGGAAAVLRPHSRGFDLVQHRIPTAQPARQ